MLIHGFHSAQNPRLLGYTKDRTGANLPSVFGPWRPVDAPPALCAVAMTVIESRGFFLARPDGMAW